MHAPLSTYEIDRLARSCPHGTYALAALHVALPAASVVGIDAHFDPLTGSTTWRGEHAVLEADSEACADQVHHLVERAWRSGDTPCALQGDTPIIKTLRSGAHHIAFGAELYIDRRVLVESTFTDPATVARAYVATAARQAQRGGSGVYVLEGNECLVHDDGRAVFLSHPNAAQQTMADIDDLHNSIDAIALELAATFDVDTFEVATLGSRVAGTIDVDYVGNWSEDGRHYDIIIPATLGSSVVLGAPYGAAAPAVQDWYGSGNRDPWYELPSYEPLAAAMVEPGWLARHRPSGIVVLIRASD